MKLAGGLLALVMKYLVPKMVAQRGFDDSLKRRVLLGANWYEHSRAEALRQHASAICGLGAKSFQCVCKNTQ